MKNENQIDPDTQGLEIDRLKTRTPASEHASCERCGDPLTGRKERFCSDACRMAVRRADQTRRIAAWLGSMEQAIAGLKDELLDETQVGR